ASGAAAATAFAGSGTRPVPSCPNGDLAPGRSRTCTATYTVTQDDADAGVVTDTATASGTPPSGPAVTSPPSTVAVNIPAAPAITVGKSADPTTVTTAGKDVPYSYVVTNTGTVALSN